MSKKKPSAEATITYIVTANQTFDINTNMSSSSIAEQQGKFWNAVAALPVGRRGTLALPNEAEEIESDKRKKSRSTQPQYLNYR